MSTPLAAFILSAQLVVLGLLWLLQGLVDEADEAMIILNRRYEYDMSVDAFAPRRPERLAPARRSGGRLMHIPAAEGRRPSGARRPSAAGQVADSRPAAG